MVSPQSPQLDAFENLDYDDDNGAIFALDEDTAFDMVRGKTKHFTNDVDENSTDSSSDESPAKNQEFSASPPTYKQPPRVRRSGRGAPLVNPSARLPSAPIAASLPVKITNGFWPPEEAIDSLPNEDSDAERDADGRPRAKTIFPQRDDEIYRNIQAYSRSIQPADDPERLFGERPRRRYRTGEYVNAGSGDEVAASSFSTTQMPMAVANDLNQIEECGSESQHGFGTGNSTNNNASTPTVAPRVIVPASLSSTGHYF
ncbi:hypothetical protein DdX_02397 [Ditylenchus destructor]|uniref:Uncharacterized protein n=1 Tax=Ditylenchus destructor TaxID=166010 RepID=A0AAD4NHL0_9BILA|nr:hypothetical protein DdX_02397 [Ditylenchus destructor]